MLDVLLNGVDIGEGKIVVPQSIETPIEEVSILPPEEAFSIDKFLQHLVDKALSPELPFDSITVATTDGYRLSARKHRHAYQDPDLAAEVTKQYRLNLRSADDQNKVGVLVTSYGQPIVCVDGVDRKLKTKGLKTAYTGPIRDINGKVIGTLTLGSRYSTPTDEFMDAAKVLNASISMALSYASANPYAGNLLPLSNNKCKGL